ncbi:uncharacterized protein LOC111119833 isoform X2 [Crassostrea virginica]|uniref:Uncharacterized protein LOC111119833 isoform X2 n=1 Tax=Crassostrea virginica TaxID=6565 RepID=A0A8B8CJZ1_CRAVI|nr:uncharacterized protein LOC111119833 isoform X2 [Crassostrea virginica]
MEGLKTSSLCSLLFFVVATTSLEIKTQHFREKHLVDQLDKVREKLQDLSASVDTLRTFTQREACALSLNVDICTEKFIEGTADRQSDLHSLVEGNPGKRRQKRRADESLDLFVEDLMRKNSALQSIQQILNNVSQKVHQEKKRSCTLNLAYHCQTSEYAGLTDLYNYLNSNASPGKRR